MTVSTFDSNSWSKILSDISQTGLAVVQGPETWRFSKNYSEKLFKNNQFHPAKFGIQAESQLNRSVRGDWTYWISSKNKVETKILSELTNIQNKLKSEMTISLNSIEAHFAFYPPGQKYDRHIDQSLLKKERQITFIHYLNENWTEAQGGELLLFEKMNSQNEKFRIEPIGGRWVFFRSELFPHQVNTTHFLRKSMTGWFRND